MDGSVTAIQEFLPEQHCRFQFLHAVMFSIDKPAMRTNIPAAAPVLGKDGSRGTGWGRSSVQFTLMKWDFIYIISMYISI